jgi:hypothetical protein
VSEPGTWPLFWPAPALSFSTWICAFVDMIHDPGEGAGVERLGHGVPVLARFLQLQRDLSHVPADVDLPHQSHLLAIFGIKRGGSLQ